MHNNITIVGKYERVMENVVIDNEPRSLVIFSVVRLSKEVDFLPVLLSDEQLQSLNNNDTFCISGQLETSFNLSKATKLTTFIAPELISIYDPKFNSSVNIENSPDKFRKNYLLNNRVIFVGELISKKAPKIKITKRGARHMQELKLVMDSNKSYSDKFFIHAIAWGTKVFESNAMELNKKYMIEGRLQSREYESKARHEKKTTYEVVVQNITSMS